MCRSKERALAAISHLKEATGKEVMFVQMDLGDLKSVKNAAREIESKEQKVDILFNNGGVMNTPINQLTTDGYECQFGTNVIGHYLFTKSLHPLLCASAKNGGARVIHSSSSALHFSNPPDLEAMKDIEALKRIGSAQMYMQSKLANLLLSNEMSRRYKDDGIVSVAVNPGNIRTGIQRHTSKLFTILSWWFFYPISLGILTGLYAGTTSEGQSVNGKYLIPWAKVAQMPSIAEQSELGKRLWDWLDNETSEY